MGKLIKVLSDNETDDTIIQAESNLKKFNALQKSMKNLVINQNVIDLSKGTTKENVKILLDGKSKIMEAYSKAKTYQSTIIKGLYPGEMKKDVIPDQLKP